MKKLFLSIIISVFTISNLKALQLDVLTGDTRLACEAMLCLASPIKPAECSTAIARYFAIKFKKPWKTINARKSFLNLCPVDNSDTEMLKYKNEILANLDGECNLYELNKRIERTIIGTKMVCGGRHEPCKEVPIYGYRVNPELTKSCYLLQASTYTDYQGFKYTCSKKFIDEVSWKRGYELLRISEEEYNLLPDNEKEKHYEGDKFKKEWRFYKKLPINKKCWIQERS
ncbi:hypothetical protein HL736_001189 [Campylobacter lari]|uniref:TrbM/KikA/MpfK family conjugal transfer protein n=1 Tax=Campylobacter volucris TaxID=1031542 RepID=UPI0018A02626|nr:TrbM/KikA/MpfK family conjugal transfer protein [Campylobacter volucris]EFO9318182.1 hypothetical protein [Campylobacter lari]MBF7049747.1 hypothetical protein [Campylobacter volucris]HED1004871.1 hypothetical protein [Campylobacter jejuni]